jgi:DNA-binding XRE family transcriptional regulator
VTRQVYVDPDGLVTPLDDTEPPQYLVGAARALERILKARHPGYEFFVEIAPYGRRLRKQRLSLGWTGAELARRAGCSASTIYALEANRSQPTPATKTKLMRAFARSTRRAS